jgi:hypothetical protein
LLKSEGDTKDHKRVQVIPNSIVYQLLLQVPEDLKPIALPEPVPEILIDSNSDRQWYGSNGTCNLNNQICYGEHSLWFLRLISRLRFF